MSSIPFLRLIFPFAAGILVALGMDCPSLSFVYCGILLMALLLCFYFDRLKTWMLFLADVFLFVYGITLTGYATTSRNDLFYGKNLPADSTQYLIAVINDVPVEKENSIRCELSVLEMKWRSSYKPAKGRLLAYFKKPVASEVLKTGTTLLIKTRLAEVPPPLNPFEFDYQNYLKHKQIYHTAFVEPGAYAALPVKSALNPIWQAGLSCKQWILSRLKSSGLSKEAYSICCALLTGYDDDIDHSVMEAFAHSGTLHVLSVSGLHIGLIYLLLGFLFDLFDRHRKHKLLKFGFITLSLWMFALLTGFSAPVLRSVIMFSLFGIGAVFFRNDIRNQLNILLVSAFALLCYNPFFITDVGFLLSYFALAGLIYFQPKLSQLYKPENRFVNYCWQSVTASAAATLSTLPLTLFYFKQFPIWFFLCNLVVVPATFVLLILALAAVFHVAFTVFLINHLTVLLIAFINIFNVNGPGFIDNISFDVADALFLSALIVIVSATLQYRRYRLAVLSLVLLIAWQCVSLALSFSSKHSSLLTVYQLKRKNLLAVKNKSCVRFCANHSADFAFHLKPHYISFNHADTLVQDFNYTATHAHKILLLNKPGFWPLVPKDSVTALVLANNFKITAADLQPFTHLKILVADGSNNNYRLQQAEELSCKFGLDFYNTTRKGAYLLALQ